MQHCNKLDPDSDQSKQTIGVKTPLDESSVERKELNCKLSGFIKGLRNKPEIICIQETWLKTVLDFQIKGSYGICRDRVEGS